MKKILIAALAALTFVLGFNTDASAKRVRVDLQIPWLAPNVLLPNGGFATSSITKPLASETLDTTGFFSLRDVDLGIFSAVKLASQDSIFAGYLSVYSDSTADGASTCTAITATIDASGDGADFSTVGTTTAILASDDPIASFMLCLRPGLDHQMLLATAPLLRIRFTTVTGILMAARVKLTYWREDGQ